jgi:N-carbamoyl-L-amino-acid hydrolase
MDTDTQVKQDITQLRVNGSRLWDSLMELARIGATSKGGVCRLTLTDLDRQGRDLVTRWAREAGMTVTIDKIGNGFMRAATSIPSPRGENSMATMACWQGWKWCARSTTMA